MSYDPTKNNKIDIRGIPKAELLVALANAAKIVKNYSKEPITIEMAKDALERMPSRTRPHIVGLAGRMLDLFLTDHMLDVAEYNKLNGEGLAQSVINEKWPNRAKGAER